MFLKLSWANIKPFLKTFNEVSGIYLLLFLGVAYIFAINFMSNYEFSVVYKTFFYLFLPVFVVPYFLIITQFLFDYNWFRVGYLTITTIVILIVFQTLINNHYPASKYDFWNFMQLGFMIALVGGIVPAITAFPFKVIHYIVFNPKKFYYDLGFVTDIQERVNSGNVGNGNDVVSVNKKHVPSTKEEVTYSAMSEIELDVALKNAIAGENYETAKIISSILNKKFR